MRLISAIANWFDQRLGARDTLEPMIAHPVPRTTASWWYVFGSATLVLFVLQIVTGICLALVYVPTADQAFQTLEYLNYQTPFGWYLRAMHFWGSNGMVLLMTLHLLQVFLFGAYKYPRELTWIIGVFLLLGTLGMAFTGQILRWDQDAYWGLGIGAAIAGRAPLIGSQMVELLLGGPIIAGRTLSRFFALHVFVIPGLLIGLVGLHLWLVLRLGINEWPMPGRLVDRTTYRQRYEAEVQRDGVPFFPVAAQKDMIGMAIVTRGCARLRGAVRAPWPPRCAGSHPDQYSAAAGFLLHGPVCPVRAVTAMDRNGGHPGWPRCRHCVSAGLAIPGRDRGKELETAAHCGAERAADCVDRRYAGWSRDHGTLVSRDGGLERSADAGSLCAGAYAARAAGGTGHPEQAMSQLP